MSDTIHRAYKTELDPNNKQRTTLVRHAGLSRFVFNWALADRIAKHEAGESTNHFEQKKRFNALKCEQFPWVGGHSSRVVQSAFDNSGRAFKNFFERRKDGVGFPKFKSRKRGIGSFSMAGLKPQHIEPGRIRLPGIGWVRLKERGYLPTEGVHVLGVTVSEKAGHWYASLKVEEARPAPVQTKTGPIGVDLGIKTLATCSTGIKIDNPKVLEKHAARLAMLQRRLSRKAPGSRNRQKTKARVASLHAKIARIRSHHIHAATHALTAKAKPSALVIEDLDVKGMIKDQRWFNRSLAGAALGEFRRQLTYKADWCGIDLVVADRNYASSKTCSVCGHINRSLRLDDRTFGCPSCGASLDRDLNAAINLKNLAVSTTATACGGVPEGDARPVLVEAGTEQPISLGATR